jgi:hypothetical protein
MVEKGVTLYAVFFCEKKESGYIGFVHTECLRRFGMEFVWDPIYGVNLVLCVIILILGVWGYSQKKGDLVPLSIGVAFGLFGISHLATLLDLKEDLTEMLIVIRTIAYLLVIFALYMYVTRKAK